MPALRLAPWHFLPPVRVMVSSSISAGPAVALPAPDLTRRGGHSVAAPLSRAIALGPRAVRHILAHYLSLVWLTKSEQARWPASDFCSSLLGGAPLLLCVREAARQSPRQKRCSFRQNLVRTASKRDCNVS